MEERELKSKQKIILNKKQKQEMLNVIKDYFYNEREEDLGDLAADMLLTFFLEKLAPSIYNQGIEDAYTFMNDKIQDLFEIQISNNISR